MLSAVSIPEDNSPQYFRNPHFISFFNIRYMELPFAEPYRIKMVEPIHRSTREERELWIKDAKYNLFNLRSEQVYIDLLTDSGTSAMSAEQWSAMMKGDEGYAGSSSYYRLKAAIEKITGFPYFLPTHQGRAAENVLFSALIKEGDIVPGNAHFDTTKGHIEFRSAEAIDCTIDEAYDILLDHPFKGNVDLVKLEKVLKKYPSGQIPLIILTATCNTAGGQPVSMQNIREVSNIARLYSIPLIIDAARFAENAYFIKTREKGFAEKSIREIVLEFFSYADGMTMSSKKDALVNIGGFIGFRNEDMYHKATTFNIMFEGFITYGGMAGRDMDALAQGLMEGTEFDYLQSRVHQVEYLGMNLKNLGIPLQYPIGGHAIFVDALYFLPNVPRNEYIAQTLAVELYLESGIRGAEVGTLKADRDPVTRLDRFPPMEFLRLAIPRRVYSQNHMDYCIAALSNVYDRRQKIKRGYIISWEAPIMRHFTVQLEKL
jgi:tryptophanase